MVCTTCDKLQNVYRFELMADKNLADELAEIRKLPADEQAAAGAQLQEKLDRVATGPTVPGGTPDAGKLPGGKPTEIAANADEATRMGLIRENESADLLAKAGYTVEQTPECPGGEETGLQDRGANLRQLCAYLGQGSEHLEEPAERKDSSGTS